MNKVKLGKVITLHRGYDLPEAKRKPGDVPIISSAGPSGFHSMAKLDGENVITGRYGTIGEVFYHRGECWPLNTALYVSDFHGNCPRYTAYLLKAVLDAANIDGKDKSTTPGVDRNVLHDLDVPYIESIDEQMAIAEVLGAIDDKISLNKRLYTKLEETAQLIYDYWFTQFDFPDKNGKPYRSSGGKMVYSGTLKREIPEGWATCDFGRFAVNWRMPILPAGGTVYEHYSIPAFDDGMTPVFEDGSAIQSGKFLVDSGCLLYSKLNPKFKRLWWPYCLSENSICSTEYIVLRPVDNAHFAYCYAVLNSRMFYAHMVRNAVSSTGSRARANADDATNFSVAIPEDDRLIESFSSKSLPLIIRAQSLRFESIELKKLRNWLLPILLSGQIGISLDGE